MKRLLAPLLLGALALPLIPSQTAGAAAPSTAKYVCLIVLDAGRPDYIAKNLKAMPNLRSLLRQARSYDRAWVGALMSITPPGHAVIGTGSLPKDDGGIVNWDWGVHRTGRVSPTLQAVENYQNGWAFKIMRQSGTPTLAGVIRKHYRGLVIAGSGSHFHAAGPMGGPDASWIFSYQRQNGYWAPFTLGKHPVPARLLLDKSLRFRLEDNRSTVPNLYDPLRLGRMDTLVMRFADRALQRYRPRAMMINLPEVDTIGHWSHRWYPDEAILYRAFDRDLGSLISTYKKAGMYKQTLFVITADHGMIQSKDRVLDRQGVLDILKSQHAQKILVNGGGKAGPTMSSIWLKDPSKNQKVAQTIFRKHLDNVSAVYYIRHSGSHYEYQLVGCNQCSAELVKSYDYLLSTEAGPNGEDVAILLRENTRNSGLPQMMGRHGGADWGSQNVTLIFSGPGVRAGVSHHPARLADLAPTIERFMGIQPDARDGIVLADAFQHPQAANTAVQDRSDVTMGTYVNALVQRAHRDVYLEAHGMLPNSVPAEERIIHWKRRWAVTIAVALTLLATAIGLVWAVAEVRRQGTGLHWVE